MTYEHTYDGIQMSVFLQSKCLSLLFTLFSKCMHQWS